MDLTGHRAGPGRAIEWAKSWPSLLRAGPRPNNGVAMLHFQNATVAHHCHVDAQQGTWLKVVAHGPGPWARSGPGLPGHPYKSCAMSRLWRGRALNRVAHRFKPLTSHGPHCRVPGQLPGHYGPGLPGHGPRAVHCLVIPLHDCPSKLEPAHAIANLCTALGPWPGRPGPTSEILAKSIGPRVGPMGQQCWAMCPIHTHMAYTAGPPCCLHLYLTLPVLSLGRSPQLYGPHPPWLRASPHGSNPHT